MRGPHLDSEIRKEAQQAWFSEMKEREYFEAKLQKARRKQERTGKTKGMEKSRDIRYIKQRSNKRLEVVVTGRKVNNSEDSESRSRLS